jgi:signal transduction histidine kinase
VLASARFVLVIGFAIYFEPSVPGLYAPVAYFLVFSYIIYALLLLVLLHLRQDSTPALRLSIHAVDTLWAALIFWFAGGNPTTGLLFENVFFIFVLLAAAYRWGLRETLVTSSVCVVFLLAQKIIGTLGLGHIWLVSRDESNLNRFLMQALSLIVTAYLVGYLGEKENQLRANAGRIAQVLGKTHSETGLRETMQAVLGTMMDLFDTDQAVLAVRQAGSGQAFLWEAERREGTQETVVRLSELESFQQERYFFQVPGQTFHAVRQPLPHRGDKRFQLLAQGSEGERLLNTAYSFPDYFLTWHPFSSLLGAEVAPSEREEWGGRLFLFDPRVGADREGEVRFLHELIQEVGPAVYSVYRLRRLRSRAMSMERARIARELHDGVIQTLIGMEMEIAVLRRQAAGDPARVADELRRIHARLREEILGVRDLIQRIKPIELNGRQFLDSLTQIVDKFRRDTGISATFVSEFQQTNLPQHLAREVTRIVQEALVNVRKHSHARSVLVRFAAEDGVWKLVIEDDGQGFEFSGRLSQAELDTTRRGPLVLKERVRSIGGELAIESVPGHGARLEIAVPQKSHG